MNESNEFYTNSITKIKDILEDIHQKYTKILWEWTDEFNVIWDYTRNAIWNVYWYFGVMEWGDNKYAEQIYWNDKPILKDYELKMNIYSEILKNEDFTKKIVNKANWERSLEDYKEVEKLYIELKNN